MLYCSSQEYASLALDSLLPGIAFVAVALIAITFHEAAHAYVAAACGDDTAKKMGRASLNPIRHIDPFGTILLPAILYMAHSPFLVGWAKPVPVDWSRLRHWRRDMAFVAAAGPLANFALAGISALTLVQVSGLPVWASQTLTLSLQLNLILAILNLIPIPPLDGSKVLAAFLPESWALRMAGLGRAIMVPARQILQNPPWYR